MLFQIPITITSPEPRINYQDKIFLIGSCFTEHIGNALKELKFSILQNPNGILFNPYSVCNSINSYIDNKQYGESDLFLLNEVWHSWQHHSVFSNTDKNECLKIINASQSAAHIFLKQADWVIITLGSAFAYHLTKQALSGETTEQNQQNAAPTEFGVAANCHRAPTSWFNKKLLGISEIISMLEGSIDRSLKFNPELKFIFTVSPVRHIRDGVIENNRSKARLIEAVHHLVHKYKQVFYFPAYEIVIDVLRDYRFYDMDMAHPNYMATEYVLEKFTDTFIEENTRELMEEVRKIVTARKHRPFQPGTQAHLLFLRSHYDKTKSLQERFPFLDLSKELDYFSQASKNL